MFTRNGTLPCGRVLHSLQDTGTVKNFMDGINSRISHIIQEKTQPDHAIKTSGFRTIIDTIFDLGVRRLNLLQTNF